jgi:hypothetical protein
MATKTILRNQKTQQANIFFKNLKNKNVLVRKYNTYSGQKQVSLIRIAIKMSIEEDIPLNQVEATINNRYDTFERRNNTIRDNRQASDDRRRRSQLLTRSIPLIAEQVNIRREKKALETQKQQRIDELEAIRRNPVVISPIVKQRIKNRKLNAKIRTATQARNITPIRRAQGTYTDLLRELAEYSLEAQQTNVDIDIVVEIIDTDTGDVRRTHNYIIPSNMPFYRWWNANQYKWHYQKNTDDEGSVLIGADINIIRSSPAQIPQVQFYLDGKEHCVLSHVKKHIDAYKLTERGKNRSTKLMTNYLKCLSLYERGVPEDKMSVVCDMFNIHIMVNYPLNKTGVLFGTSKRPDKIIRLTNTRFNHLEDIGDLINMMTDNRITISRAEVKQMKLDMESNGEYCLYTKDSIGVSSIITKEAIYETNTEFKTAVKNFEELNNISGFKLCDVKDKEITAYIKQGTHYNTSCLIAGRPDLILNGEDKTQHIDLRKAYLNSNLRADYVGFPGKITDMRPTDRIEGNGLYTVSNVNVSKCSAQFKVLNEKMSLYKSGGVYTNVELNDLTHHGGTYDVVFGCWSSKSVDIKFGDEMLKKTPEGSSYYALLVGKYDSHNPTTNYYTFSTQDYFNNIANNSENTVKYFGGNNELKIEVQKDGNQHYSHFTAFVLAYMRLTMIDQLMTMDLKKVNFVYVDGIYYQPHDFEIINGFRIKPSCWWKHYETKQWKTDETKQHFKDYEPIRNDYMSNNETLFESAISTRFNGYFNRIVKQPRREHYKIELFIGAGGTGKTHINLIDTGLIRPLYVATSHKLVAEKMKEYGVCGEVLENLLNEEARVFKSGNINKYYNVLIIDEASQIRNCDMKRVLMLYPNHKIIVCGDVGFQLEPINTNNDRDGGDIEHSLFDNVREFKENYRCKCPVLGRKNTFLRALISSDSWGNPRLDESAKDILLVDANIIKLENVKGKYNEIDSIITGTKEQRQIITDLVKDTVKNKYIITKRCEMYNVGDIILQQEKHKNGRLEHAHTIHSVQGLTIDTKLFIDIRKCVSNMSLRMLYTAISRARHFKNIYFIVD